jgi:hypothetical protein
VYANLQGPKNNKCPHYHSLEDGSPRAHGNIIKMECKVKLYFLTPSFDDDGKPSTKHMVIISYGEHTHPPPPPRKIPAYVKEKLINLIQKFGAAEATARKLVASPLLSVMLDGRTSLSQEHISLTNHSAINNIIRQERLREHPLGTDFEGARHLMLHRGPADPYIRQCIQFPDGHFVVLCQFPSQSDLFFQSFELQCDKTFARTHCREFEFNSFSHATRRTTTLARVFTDYEDEDGYYQAFKLTFSTAEKDVDRKIPWGHLIDEKQSSTGTVEPRIKAILVDEHGGQIKGMGRYFSTEYPMYGDAEWHILRIIKVCQVHFERSIKRLQSKGVSEGRSYLTFTC